jgi:hypothetical protein
MEPPGKMLNQHDKWLEVPNKQGKAIGWVDRQVLLKDIAFICPNKFYNMDTISRTELRFFIFGEPNINWSTDSFLQLEVDEH